MIALTALVTMTGVPMGVVLFVTTVTKIVLIPLAIIADTYGTCHFLIVQDNLTSNAEYRILDASPYFVI